MHTFSNTVARRFSSGIGLTSLPALALGLAVLANSLSSSLPAQQSLRGRMFKDQTNGYSFTIPSKWVRLPTNVEEKWIVAHFVSKKEYVGSAKAGDSLMGHKPYMKVIMFDEEVIRKTIDVEKSGNTTIKTLHRPYRNYKDYVKRNLGGGGYYFHVDDKEATIGKLQVMQYEIKLEKLTMDKKRYIGWVFATQGVKFAVEFEVLESQVKKLRSQITTALRSFKFIERRGGAKTSDEDAILRRTFSRREWAKLSARKRMEIRKEKDKAREKKMLARLPEGWTSQSTKHFLVLSHSSKKFTKRVTDAAEIFRKWLGKRFDKLNDEYPMKAVIRICKNAAEYRSYHSGSSETSFGIGNREIVTYNDYTNVGINSGGMFWQIYGYYMQDKAPGLVFNTPIWLDSGLDSYISSAVLSGRKLVFQRSVREFGAFAELRRGKPGNIKTAKELMNLDSIGSFRDKAVRELNLGSQLATFFRFMEGDGRRLKFLRGKDFVIDYMRSVIEVSKEYDERAGISIGTIKEATTEEEEEAQEERSRERWKEYARQAKARRAEFLGKLRKHVDQWTDAQWADLEKGYVRYHSKKSR